MKSIASPVEHAQLESKLIDMAFGKINLSVISALLLAALIVAALWSVIEPARLLTWLGVMTTIMALHIVYLRGYLRFRNGSNAASGKWKAAFIAGSAAAGLGWGSTVFYFPSSPFNPLTVFGVFVLPSTPFDPVIVLLIFILAGISAYSSIAMATVPPAVNAFLLCVWMPLALWLFSFGEQLYVVMGLIASGYLGVMVLLSRRMHATICSLITVSDENRGLRSSEQENELRMAHYFESAPGFFYTSRLYPDGHSAMPFTSPNITELFGLTSAEVAQSLVPLFAMGHPEDIAILFEKRVESARSLSPLYCEFRIAHPKKGERWMELNSHPQREAEGSTVWHGFMQDITGRKQAEVVLKKRETEFRMLAENSPDPIYRFDRDCRRIYINPAVEKLTGTPREKLLNKSPAEAMPVTSANALQTQQIIQRVLDTGNPGELEITFTATDGRECTVLNTLVPEFAADGSVESVLCIGRDISTRKRVEKIMQESESEYRTLAENSPGSIIRFDKECRALYLNKKCEVLLGMPTAFMLNKTLSEVFSDGLFDEFELVMQGVVETRRIIDYDLILPDTGKGEHYYRFTLTPEQSAQGEFAGVLVVGHDITESKRYEQELLARAKLEQRLSTLTENVPGFVFTIRIDTNGHTSFPYVSAGIEQLFGLRQEEVYDDAAVLRARYHPDDLPRIYDLMEETKRALVPFRIEIRITNRDNELSWIEIRSMPQRQPDGATEWHGMMLDITERKRLEMALIEREREFRSLAENLPDNIARWDVEGRIIHSNSIHQRTLGKSASELIGKTHRESFPDGRYDPVDAGIAQVITTGQAALYVRQPVTFENGETEIHDVKLVPERDADGKVISVLGVGRNMTELYRLQDDLKASEQQMRSLADSSPGMMSSFYARPDGSVCMPYASPNIEKLFGLLPQDVVHDASPLLARNHPDDAQRISETIAESARTMTTWHEEFRILHPTRGELWIESITNPQPHPEGGVIWYGYLHDVTERKEAEQTRAKLARALKLLSESGMLLVQAKSEQELLDEACRFAVEIGGYLLSWVGLAENDEHKTVRPVAQCGFEEGYLDGINVTWADTEQGQVPIGIAIRTGVAAINHDFENYPKLAPWREAAIKRGFRSSIALPLVSNGLVLGTLNIYSAEVHAFGNNEEVVLLQELADNLALGIGILRTRVEKERIAQNLAQREREYRVLAENTPDSIYRYDRDYRRLYVNPTVCRIVGKSAQELIGSTIDDGRILVSEQGKLVMDHIDRVFDSGEQASFMVDFIDQNGEHNDYHMWIVPEHDADGRVATVLGFTRDVTELRRLERRQSQYFAMAPGVFMTTLRRTDGSYTIPFISDGVRDVYGVEPEAVMRDIMVFVSLVHPDDAEMSFRKTEESARDLTPFHIECRMNHPQKGVRWIECRSTPQRLPDGSVCWYGFYHDITERKQNQRQSELLGHAVNQSSDAMFLIDEQLRFAYVNERACCSLGYSAEELLTMSPVDIDPNITREILAEMMKSLMALEGKPSRIESCHRTSDGRIFPVEIVATAVKFGDVKYGLTVVRDITERKDAQAQMSRFMNNMPGFAYSFRISPDGHTSFPFVSRGIEDIYGLTPEEVRDDMTPLHLLSHPEDRPRTEAAIAESARTMAQFLVEVRVQRPGHPERWIECRAMPEREADGSILWQGVMLDINERKRMESALRDQAGFQGTLLTALSDADVQLMMIENGKIIFIGNRELARGFGYTDAEIDAHPALLDLIHPDDRARVMENYQRRLAGEDVHSNYEMGLITKDGVRREFDTAIAVVPDTNPVRIVTIGRDVTERKRMEEALRESQEKLSDLFKLSPLGLALTDMQGRYIEFNEAFRAICGYPADELMTLDYWTLTPREYEAKEGEQLESLARTGRYGPYEKVYRQKDGSLIPIQLNGTLIHGKDGQQYIWSIVEDISERKRLEKSLIEREREFRSLADNLPDNIARWDVEGRYLYINPTHERTLGVVAQDVIGKQIPDTHEHVKATIAQVVSTGQAVQFVRQTVVVDGESQIHDVNIVPERNDAGNVVAVLGLGRNMTELYRLQDNLSDAQKLALLGSWEWDVVTNHIEWSEMAYELYTPDKRPAEPGFGDFTSSLHADDMERVLAAVQAAFDHDTPFDLDHRVVSDSKGVRTVHAQGKLFRDAAGKPIRMVGTVQDITERKRMEDVLKFIAQGEWLHRDEDFLTALASYLGGVLDLDYVIVDKLAADPAYAETVAIYAKGAVVPNMQYGLQYTPCENVMNGGLCCYPENIQQQFPKDILLVDMQVESYAGIPLWDSKGNVIGLIALMDGKPMSDTNLLTSMLQLVATSAAAALERQQADAKLKVKFEQVVELNNRLEINARDLEDQAAEFEAQAVELEASQEQIMQTEAWYRNIVRSAPDGMVVVNENGLISLVNLNIEKMFGYAEGELIGHPIEMLLPSDTRRGHVAKRDGFFASGSMERPMDEVISALRACRKDGSEFPVYVSLSRLPDMDGRTGVICAAIRDVTEHKRLEDALAAREHEARTLIENSPDNISRYNRDCRRIFVNQAFAASVDGGVGALLGKKPTESPGGPNADLYEAKILAVFETGENNEFELRWPNKDAREICSHVRMTAERDTAGKVVSVLTVGRDITELNEHRKRVYQMAFYDSLTSLPNRALFHDRLRQMIADASWHEQLAGVMLLDLDRFKAVNDTLGHPAGDELLREAAARLSYCVRGYDTVARLGGDEFAILLPEIRSGDDLGRVASKIVESFNQPFLLEGKEVFVTTSVGISVYPADSEDSDDLLKQADSAMYFAKRSGRNNFRFYSKDLTTLSNERLLLEGDLHRGFGRGELELYYQPKVSLADGMLIGSEALLRWNHPQRGIVPPDKFISIAEDSGLIVDIGEWVLRDACRVACEWNDHGKPLHKVAINLSARQFQSNDLVKTVRKVLDETHCYPEWIELEITESLLLDEAGDVLETLERFREMGITIAIDDFGTGYSSLSYLARFPIDTLKIDRSFTSRVSEGGHHPELVKAIISIAHSLKQKVVAEGVETVEQAAILQAYGCHIAQGYLYSKPVPKVAFEALPRSFGLEALI